MDAVLFASPISSSRVGSTSGNCARAAVRRCAGEPGRRSMNGTFSSFAASNQANWLSPAIAGLGGVCGSIKLNAASAIDARPATVNV